MSKLQSQGAAVGSMAQSIGGGGQGGQGGAKT